MRSAILAYLSVSAQPMPSIPLPIFIMCSYTGQLSMDIVFISMSLVYGTKLLLLFIDHLGNTNFDHSADFLAFSVIVYLVVRSNLKKVPIPGLFKTIAQDATYYFLVIFTSHLLLMFIFWFANVSTSSQSSLLSTTHSYLYRVESQCTPKYFLASEPTGSDQCLRYLSVMITRLLLSLKKASTSQEHGWSFGEPTIHSTMRFAELRGGVSTRDEVPLDTFLSTHEGSQGQE